jgi:hypothetical protein
MDNIQSFHYLFSEGETFALDLCKDECVKKWFIALTSISSPSQICKNINCKFCSNNENRIIDLSDELLGSVGDICFIQSQQSECSSNKKQKQ